MIILQKLEKSPLELQALVNRRQQLVEMLSAERNRQSSVCIPKAKAQVERHIEWLKEECMRKLLVMLNAMLKHHPFWTPLAEPSA